MYAQVIVDIASEQVDRVFTYRVPDFIHLGPGFRVRVPFGRIKKEGYVISLSDTTDLPEEKVRDIESTLEDYPALLPQLLTLAQEISEETRCPLCEAIRLMLPAQMRGERIKVKTEPMAVLAFDASEMEEKLQTLSKRAIKKRTILRILSDGQPHSVEEIRTLVRDPQSALKELNDENLIRLFEQEALRAPLFSAYQKTADPTLKPQQEEALEALLEALDDVEQTSEEERENPVVASRFEYLLHGVTGSGKTEVYIRLVRACMEKGKTAIVLVPEIALSPQMVDWFRARFGECAAVLHSRLTPGERFDEWRRIRRGDASVVIGARSAVFAPVSNLGAIIIDEEHEQTYQAENYPQYDAREIAKSRCRRERAILLLASATPSIYSYAMARRGDFGLLQMPERVNERPLPNVLIADMRKQLQMGNRSIFSYELQEKLGNCIASGQQAILFINRRGYAPSVSCRACGEVIHCSQCDVAMTYHSFDNKLHCHYCGNTMGMPKRCPSCGSDAIRTVGIGTQKVEEEVHRLFPSVKTIRMDLDTTGTKNAHYELINAFRAREAQVLIGTQMIAKGLDFPQVTLVGAILADLSLNMPDYRAEERTFQLLVQVAGRAGRSNLPGEVVIQTYKPDSYAIQAAANQDYKDFFEHEFARRRGRLYPPFTNIARFLIEADDPQTAMDSAEMLKEKAGEWIKEHPLLKRKLLYIRADEAPIAYIQGRYRAQVLMKLINNQDGEKILGALRDLVKLPLPDHVRATLEINPSSLA